MYRIAVLDDFQQIAAQLADWLAIPDSETTFFHDHVVDVDALADRLAPFDAVVLMRERTPFGGALIRRLPKLRLLVTSGMRSAVIDFKAAAELGITVSGTSGIGYQTAEFAWAMLGALARDIPAQERSLRAGDWQTSVGVTLKDKTLGLLGLGKLGSIVAGYARAFGMDVLAWSQNLTAERAAAEGAKLVPLDELMSRSDFVSIHLVLSERTRGLIGARELALMKPGAFLINTSRGPIVDEQALIDALTENRLRGAGLDVFDQEPIPPDHPLLTAPRTLLTPHLGYVSVESYRVIYGQVVDNINAFRSGSPLRVLAPE